MHHVQRRLHGAGTFHRVLLPKLGQHRVQVQAQLSQALLRNFNVDFFVLGAKQFHFVDIGHPQQLLPHIVGDVTDFSHGKALGLDGINHAIDIAEVIVEKWPDHPLRQGLTHVADFFAYRVPDVGDLRGFGGVFDLKNDLRLARLGVAANLVSKWCFLQGALKFVGDLLRHLLGGGTWPIGANHHGAKGERRIFVLSKLEIGGHTQDHQHHHQVAGQGWVHKRPQGQVESLFGFVRAAHGLVPTG